MAEGADPARPVRAWPGALLYDSRPAALCAWPVFCAYEDLRCQAVRPPARLVRRRRVGQDARAPCDADRRRAARQAQARPTRRTSTPATSSIVVNAEKIAVTGNKRADKLYHRHSGYPGGLRTRTLEQMLGAAARGGHPARRQGHDAAQPAGPEAADQAQGLRRARSIPTSGAEAARDGAASLMADDTPTPRAARGGAGGAEARRRAEAPQAERWPSPRRSPSLRRQAQPDRSPRRSLRRRRSLSRPPRRAPERLRPSGRASPSPPPSPSRRGAEAEPSPRRPSPS